MALQLPVIVARCDVNADGRDFNGADSVAKLQPGSASRLGDFREVQ